MARCSAAVEYGGVMWCDRSLQDGLMEVLGFRPVMLDGSNEPRILWGAPLGRLPCRDQERTREFSTRSALRGWARHSPRMAYATFEARRPRWRRPGVAGCSIALEHGGVNIGETCSGSLAEATRG